MIIVVLCPLCDVGEFRVETTRTVFALHCPECRARLELRNFRAEHGGLAYDYVAMRTGQGHSARVVKN